MRSEKSWPAIAAMLLLSACATVPDAGISGSAPNDVEELPAEVLALAAPHQDLTSVRIQPEDGCYWYKWIGHVETTYLPVRTVDGRPICTR
ncbi:hypothetical protein [Tropicimonas marinistellae]|uniref:hypothetical protein n=1 Tax=Tropicimonas marinistellae TaxID=1739787 RepID=UPI0008332C81|nr:hypothetical protein [Tropicimonas marinistellae]